MLIQAQEVFGRDSVSVDLLFGKPGDDLESWKEELDKILSYCLSHVSLYELTPEKGTPLFNQVLYASFTCDINISLSVVHLLIS